MTKYRYLLGNRKFVLYSIGQGFSQFGDRLVQIVLIGFVYHRWPGSTFQLAKLFFFTIIPSFFISPMAGVFVDRFDRKKIIVLCDLVRSLLVLLIPLFFVYSKNAVPIYITIFFIFAASCFFLPARLSIIPELIHKDRLILANSASSLIWVTSGIAGFSFGGFVVEWIGVRNSLYFTSLIYGFSFSSFLSLAYFFRLKDTKQMGLYSGFSEIKSVIKNSFYYDFKEGFKLIISDKKIRFVLGIFFVGAGVFGILWVVGVVFVQEILHSVTKHIGLFGVYLSIGIFLGSYVYGKVGHRLPKRITMSISFILMGCCIILFTQILFATRSVLLGSVLMWLLGFFSSPLYVIGNTIIHESVELAFRGRVFSLLGIINNLGFILFMFLGSVLGESIEKLYVLILCGSLLILAGITGLVKRFEI